MVSMCQKKLYEAYANGAAKDIDMLMGSNKDEARYWIGEVGGLLPYKIGMPIIYENYFAKLSDADKEKVKTFMNVSTWVTRGSILIMNERCSAYR